MILTASLSQEELAVLSILDMFKPQARNDRMENAGLGEYNVNNEYIKSLTNAGFIKVIAGKKIQLDKEKAKVEMKKHPVPKKYMDKLTNWHSQFDTHQS